MPLDGIVINDQIDSSLSTMLLLHSSCQAVIEADIQQVASPWYDRLDQELGSAENLVLAWRKIGVLYFKTQILDAVANASRTFLSAASQIDALFTSLEQAFSASKQAQLIAALQALQPPIASIASQTDDYLARLKSFEASMIGADQAMRSTIGQVQAQEATIQDQIDSVNAKIQALNNQIQTDRAAIAQARSERTGGIIETIFGVLLAPVTGGLSLALAGIGVASIAEAQGKIDGMESEISSYQLSIAGDQTELGNDQKIVATLNALTLSTGLVLADMGGIESALDALRISWTAFDGELIGVIFKLQNAVSSDQIVVQQAWYNAASAQWKLISDHITSLGVLEIYTRRTQVG